MVVPLACSSGAASPCDWLELDEVEELGEVVDEEALPVLVELESPGSGAGGGRGGRGGPAAMARSYLIFSPASSEAALALDLGAGAHY